MTTTTQLEPREHPADTETTTDAVAAFVKLKAAFEAAGFSSDGMHRIEIPGPEGEVLHRIVPPLIPLGAARRMANVLHAARK
ncbi:hypothetical protein ACWCWQ_02275 [Streptomyces sp. NPDC001571]